MSPALSVDAESEPPVEMDMGKTCVAVISVGDEKKVEVFETAEEVVQDPWALVEPTKKGKDWSLMTYTEKSTMVAWLLVKFALLLGLLYFFVCSLSFLGDAFRLLGGKAAGKAFSSNAILNNPVSNLMMGILATVLLQSSSTTTSIVVTMVAADLLTVRPAIFIIMGSNIGTSVTNTIIALGQVSNRDEFRRAFAGATVHDMFNWLSVLCLLPIEWITGSIGSWNECGVLCQLTGVMTRNLHVDKKATKQELLKAITKPFTNLIIRLDKNVIKKFAKNEMLGNETLVKHMCTRTTIESEAYMSANKTCQIRYVKKTVTEHCNFMFEHIANTWSDDVLGVVLLILALLMLCLCLILIVKLLHSVLRGKIALVLRHFINADFPGVFRHLTGYVAILVGAGLTMLVQSSSIFTSALTPLVGVSVLHLDRMYPLTLGANIGTTFTAILAALAADRTVFQKALQVALSHLFFNIFGILIWYPIPAMRSVPIDLAKMLGNTTAKYRWFPIAYLAGMFFMLPAFFFGLSVAGNAALLGVGVPVFFFFVLVAIVNVVQRKKPKFLPRGLRTWNWLPLPLHSLAPIDDVIGKIMGTCKRCVANSEPDPTD